MYLKNEITVRTATVIVKQIPRGKQQAHHPC